MKYISTLFALLLCLYTSAQDQHHIVEKADVFGGQIFLEESDNWKFHAGNNSSWSEPDFDDTSWRSLNLFDVNKSMVDDRDIVEGWFRLTFELSEDLNYDEWYFRYMTWAPGEVYLDGQLIKRFGELDLDNGYLKPYNAIAKPLEPIRFKVGQKHVIAIHVMDQMDRVFHQDLRSKLLEHQNSLILNTPDYAPGYNRLIGPERYLYGTLRIGVCIFLALFFALLYYLNPLDNATWYAVLLMSIFAIGAIGIEARNMQDMSFMWVSLFALVSRWSFGAVIFITPFLLAKVLEVKLSRNQLIVLWVSLGVIILPIIFNSNFPPQTGTLVCMSISIYLIVRHRSKIKGSTWAVIIGLILSLLLLIILASGVIINRTNTFIGIQILATAGILTFPLSLLVFMAIRYKEINVDIREKANHIVNMTELRRQEEVKQRIMLEGQLKALKENSILKMYVDDSVMNFMGDKNTDEQLMNSESINATVMFVDICGFTAYSEKADAKEVVELLNSYFDIMVKEITSNGGYIDKFIGDAVMAVFKKEDHPKNAARCAINIRKAINALPESDDTYTPQVTIGINTGDMVSGNIGSASLKRLDFTVIGATVNIAQRLESIANEDQIVVSQSMFDSIGDQFNCQDIGSVNLKHVHKPMKVYQLVG